MSEQRLDPRLVGLGTESAEALNDRAAGHELLGKAALLT